MIAMSTLRKKEQLDVEICYLRKSFNALTIDNQKRVIKTARELLRVQKKAHTTIAMDSTGYSIFFRTV
jgi:hypothetical protein